MNQQTYRIIDLVENLPETTQDTNELHAKITAEINSLQTQNNIQSQLQDVQLALSDYLEAVKMVIDDTFNHEVWIRAEIRAMSSKAGHYYFELAEKNDSEQIIASCRATLWRYRASNILAKFRQNTGRSLEAGTNVLIKASASFHAQYGFSINISDIDPNYTLGELAAAYRAMLKRLHDEGHTQLNRSLSAPFDIRHVLVIAPENAAGLGDFRADADRLMTADACHFYYHYATFQGNHAPHEIRHAIANGMNHFINTHAHLPDLLVIIRGGGAVGDLAYLNDYELAALIAEQPVPVWTGIGHERDRVLIDEVAHTHFDTPSKVIGAIERQLVSITQDAKIAMQTIQTLNQKHLTRTKNNSETAIHRIKSAATKLAFLAKKDSRHEMNRTQLIASHHLDRQKIQINARYQALKTQARHQVHHAKTQTNTLFGTHQNIKNKLNHLKEHCQNLQSIIMIQHPTRTLAKGYALICQDGRIISSSTHIDINQDLQIEFHDGKVHAVPHQSIEKPSNPC